jgi:hypothetical protein
MKRFSHTPSSCLCNLWYAPQIVSKKLSQNVRARREEMLQYNTHSLPHSNHCQYCI